MNKAETLFRSFFASKAEYRNFSIEHTVLTGRRLPYGKGSDLFSVVVIDNNHQPCSFDDKPSVVEVDFEWMDATIVWHGKGKHRLGKPAFVNLDSDSFFVLEWWEKDKRIRREAGDFDDLPKDKVDAKLRQIRELIA